MQDRRYKKLQLKNIQANNFLMTPLELKDYINFDVKRVYFISAPKNEMLTGAHCHKRDEDELFVMVQGSSIAVLDDGHGLEEVQLIAKKDALYIPTLVWHHFKEMSSDAIILAISSTNYDPSRNDYCEDYTSFKKLLQDEGLLSK